MQGVKLPLINPKKQGGLGYSNSGTLYVDKCEIVPVTAMPPTRPMGYEVHFSATKVAKMDGYVIPFAALTLLWLSLCSF